VDALQQQRRMTVRSLLGLVRRVFTGKMRGRPVGELLDEYFVIKRRWRLVDTPWAVVDRLLRLVRPTFGRPNRRRPPV
jgi:hypothetical protein